MERTILHSDMNSCYASIELLHHPELRGKPVAVGGDPEARHGIVLAKDPIAKKCGVKTGMALWQARQVCPNIIFVPPHMDLYLRFSRIARQLYGEYTDRVESFGLDECWLDVTRNLWGRGTGEDIAREINRRMREELGVTVSVGVSWNKILAKLGSDYKKPDAVTVIDHDNFESLVWPLPASDLLYVGPATDQKLKRIGVHTIGQLAQTDPELLHGLLGKMGWVLYAFANGHDETPVEHEDFRAPVKSIGNSTTTPRDLVNDTDVKVVMDVLSESVGARLREDHFHCRVVEISVRDNELYRFTRQTTLERPTDLTLEIAHTAFALFRKSYDWRRPLRSVGVRACDLSEASGPVQTSLFISEEQREKQHRIDETVDEIRRRYGGKSIRRGSLYLDRGLAALDAKEDNTVHPRGYFLNGNQTGAGHEEC